MNKDFLKREFGDNTGNLYEGFMQDIDRNLEQDNGEDVSRADLQVFIAAAREPDPARRLTIARQHWGERLLPVFHPDTPRGHGGVYEPAFDERFGAAVAAFAR